MVESVSIIEGFASADDFLEELVAQLESPGKFGLSDNQRFDRNRGWQRPDGFRYRKPSITRRLGCLFQDEQVEIAFGTGRTIGVRAIQDDLIRRVRVHDPPDNEFQLLLGRGGANSHVLIVT